ncbi:hypothetical protein ACH5RR_018158 [Cinchona calisaya]|uniref:Uncharacterized protein n=1 Tax=Cinchona calisaya TaxID=153742 RepID=A0ABD2ZLJ6_9GENT
MALKTIYSYFNKRGIKILKIQNSSPHTQSSQVDTSTSNFETPSQANASASNLETSTSSLEQVPKKVLRIESKDFDMSSMERDPRKRMSIWNYSPDQQDEVRRAYIKVGPFRHIPENSAKFIDKLDCKFLVSCLVSSSTKRSDQLINARVDEIENLVSSGELETGKCKNQIRNLSRPGDTRWGSYYESLSKKEEVSIREKKEMEVVEKGRGWRGSRNKGGSLTYVSISAKYDTTNAMPIDEYVV